MAHLLGTRPASPGSAVGGTSASLVPLLRRLARSDPGAVEHARGVAELSLLIGRRLGLPADRLALLHLGAIVHDVGKVVVPRGILAKADALTAREWEVVRRHPAAGERLLERKVEAAVLEVVRHHHERWDGRGYPAGLAGLAIPLTARIVAVADAFHAMVQQRPYRRALTRAEALLEVARHEGTQFDPDCARALTAGRRPRANRPPRG